MDHLCNACKNISKWISVSVRLPELGKKVLCRKDGDFYVALFVEDRFFPIPYPGPDICKLLCDPQEWCEIDFPAPWTGKLRFKIADEDRLIDMGELKKRYPHKYKIIVESMIKSD